MQNLVAYRCLECGHYNISKYDGKRCSKCNGALVPMGNATYVDKSKEIAVEVRLKDTKLFNRMLDVYKALLDDKHTPKWIKVKIKRLVLDEIKED